MTMQFTPVTVDRTGDAAQVRAWSLAFTRCGDVEQGITPSVVYRRVGKLREFKQTGKSESLRRERVALKAASRLASE